MAKKKKSYWTHQFKAARLIWSRHSLERKECFAMRRETKENGLHKWNCAICLNWFSLSEIDCDHLDPIQNTIPQTIFEYYECFDRLNVSVNRLQILCKSCHKIKTKYEIKLRKDILLVKLVEGYMINEGWNLKSYSIKDLDKGLLRQVCNLFAKNEKITNGRLVVKNNNKIIELLKPCFIESQKYG
jgi:5-methylcytosine-specific restriction endonuclease McrA